MSATYLDFISHSVEQTRRIGARLSALAQAGDVFLLQGALGAGKTCFAQGVAQGLDIPTLPTSPSFVFVNEYTGGRLPLYHIDLYRINDPAEVDSLGLDDYFYGNGLCVVEWADKALQVLPTGHLLVLMRYIAETKRSLRLAPQGKRYQAMVSEFRQAAFGL